MGPGALEGSGEEEEGSHPLGKVIGEGAEAHPPFLSRQLTTLSAPRLCPTEVLVPAGPGGPDGDRGGRQPSARGQRNRAAL